MSGFPRDPEAAARERYDLIVLGAGIYGICVTLEAARRGLRPLLLERDDFGGATSLNSLRILHGGLRYLQSFDLARFFESTRDRHWFLSNFGPLCCELPCLMPLYGKGLKRKDVFRIALALNHLLSGSHRLTKGRVLSPEQVRDRFPSVDSVGLEGGALWHDGQILSPQRLHAEMLRWSVALGARTLNYVTPRRLLLDGGGLTGLATDSGEFSAPVIINAAGPWSDEVGAGLTGESPDLMTPSLTFNLLINREPPSDAAVAVEDSEQVYFVTPHRSGRTFAGTIHRAWSGRREPDEDTILGFLQGLNEAIPGWDVRRSDVDRVTAGVLPSKGPGQAEMAHRSSFRAHGPRGFYSLCGIKYTTAPGFARTVLDRVFGASRTGPGRPDLGGREAWVDPNRIRALDDAELARLIQEESVTRVDDLLDRRMDWIDDERNRLEFAERVEGLLQPNPALRS